jgi:anaphase-promoting complex subunit 6
MDLAEEHFLAAAQLNSSDPLVLNELGVAAHNREDHAAAIDYFQRAIAVAGTTQGSQATWSSTHCNLGHSLRLLRRFPEARAAYAQAIHLDPLNHTAVAAQAMLSHLEGDIRSAIRLYHNALSLAPQDPVPNVLLEMALNEQCDALDPTTLPGLPPAIARADLDPFAVPKGNSAFGPLPVEADPQTLEEAGDHSRDMTFEPDMSFSQNFQEHEYSRSIAFAPTPHAHGNAHLGVGAGVRAGASGSRSPRTPGYEASYNESSMMEIEDD